MDEKTPLVSSDTHVGRSVIKPVIERAVTNDGDTQATVNCQVCRQIITFTPRERQMVVRCPHCSEATPIKGPPAGKQYVRCPCNCLLVCNEPQARLVVLARNVRRLLLFVSMLFLGLNAFWSTNAYFTANVFLPSIYNLN
uniref:Phosphatidylinositol-4,5-bisphosphate 4-phosphatase n=1 Tax=Schistosoma japonicum TaxID=6182 RepID=C1L584_SCHJA|nr:hypothetical protein [Schistosoma japonicum]